MALIVVPARLASHRLPGKPLLAETGRALVVHVVERLRACRQATRVIVATDDAAIVAAVEAAGGEAMMTSPDHPSGTDRVAEVARAIDGDPVVNVQGDEPEIDPAHVDRLIEALLADPDVAIATLAAPIESDAAFADPNVVKVVCDGQSRALYFSRAPIPHRRDRQDRDDRGAAPLRHAGVYAFRREALFALTDAAPTPLERAERLEQLRALEHGRPIRVVVVGAVAPGIDTRDQYDAFVARERARSGSSTPRSV